MPPGALLRHWLALLLPRWLAVALGIRRLAPGNRRPTAAATAVAPPIDTGGGYRAENRRQDPSVDPREPGGGESSSAGNDHGWSNCTLASGATALAYQYAPDRGDKTPWGGDLRHSGQPDMSGGTDLYDLKAAWAEYNETLTIKSGAGWSAVKTAHSEGRAIVIQGSGNVPGSATFDGGHACVIAPETHSDGDWLFGDPLVSGWQWIAPDAIKGWADNWQSSIAFAVGEKPPPPPEPEPEPKPPPAPKPPPPGPGYDVGYASGHRDGRNAEADAVFASWFMSATGTRARWDAVTWGGAPTQPTGPNWSDGYPKPVGQVVASRTPATWHRAAWTAALWQDG